MCSFVDPLRRRAGDVVAGGAVIGRTSSTTTDEMFVKDSEQGNNPGMKEESDEQLFWKHI